MALNRVQDDVQLGCSSLRELSDPADIVTANLDPMTLMANKDKLLGLCRHYLIVSGVPLDQWGQVKGLFETGKATLKREIIQSEWGCGLFEASSPAT